MFTRLLKYSLKNIARNKFLSLSSILVLTLLMFFINILLLLHNVSFKLIDSINSKMTISLYLAEWYDKNSSAVIDLINQIRWISSTLNIDYKDKDQVLDEIRQQDLELVKILEKSNPLPDTITISNIALSLYDDLNYVLAWKVYLFSEEDNNIDWKISNDYSSYKSQYERINKVTTVLQSLSFWLYAIILVFLISIAIIIYSIIWNFIYYYKDEIYITRLVWWSKLFIFWPFSMQWMIYSVISFFISMIIFFILLKNIVFVFWEQYSLSFLFNNIALIFFLELLLFMLIGWLSWYFSSKKYLK